jgi:hypothetical protein
MRYTAELPRVRTGAIVNLCVIPGTHREDHPLVHIRRHLMQRVERWVPTVVYVGAVGFRECRLRETACKGGAGRGVFGFQCMFSAVRGLSC